MYHEESSIAQMKDELELNKQKGQGQAKHYFAQSLLHLFKMLSFDRKISGDTTSVRALN